MITIMIYKFGSGIFESNLTLTNHKKILVRVDSNSKIKLYHMDLAYIQF